MKLFELTNTTRKNLQIATHKSASFTPHIVLICALAHGRSRIKAAVRLVMLNDRSLVLYNEAGKSQWSTETCNVYQGSINF